MRQRGKGRKTRKELGDKLKNISKNSDEKIFSPLSLSVPRIAANIHIPLVRLLVRVRSDCRLRNQFPRDCFNPLTAKFKNLLGNYEKNGNPSSKMISGVGFSRNRIVIESETENVSLVNNMCNSL